MTATLALARQEWRAGFKLPVAAALGYATSVIHIYGLGAYIRPISETFGWSVTQTTAGLTIATLIQAVFGIPIGILVDKVGPRLLGVIGIITTLSAFALLGTATGTVANWYLLWIVMACATLPVQATIWTSAVASRFEASRGLAFAVTLCGASVAAALFPSPHWRIWMAERICHTGRDLGIDRFSDNFVLLPQFTRFAKQERRDAGRS